MLHLSDPLTHVVIDEAMMDAQIKLILRMSFARYPNQTAIQAQLEELSRINQSYQMVRADPSHPLANGLKNFRIGLFNRVGELVMEGQAGMGPSSSGFQVVAADQRSCPVRELTVTRGLTDI